MLDLNRLIDRVCELVSLPDVYMRLRRALADPTTDLATVATILETDPAVAARLLRVANSPLFGFVAAVDSVARAVTLLGTQRVHDLVLSTTIATMFKGLSYDATNVYSFWKKSVLRANAAKILAREFGIHQSERLFLLGLLSDIGHLVLFEQESRQMQAVFVYSVDRGISLAAAERDLLGFDYATVGSALADRWKMPTLFVNVIAEHLTPNAQSPCFTEASVVHVAMWIAVEGEFDEQACLASLHSAALQVIDPAPGQLIAVREEAVELVADTLSMIYS